MFCIGQLDSSVCNGGGGRGREPGRTGVREVGEAGEKRAGCGSEMQNATPFHLVCIKIPKEQERGMIFDLHQGLLSNQANKNWHLV